MRDGMKTRNTKAVNTSRQHTISLSHTHPPTYPPTHTHTRTAHACTRVHTHIQDLSTGILQKQGSMLMHQTPQTTTPHHTCAPPTPLGGALLEDASECRASSPPTASPGRSPRCRASTSCTTAPIFVPQSPLMGRPRNGGGCGARGTRARFFRKLPGVFQFESICVQILCVGSLQFFLSNFSGSAHQISSHFK